VSKMIFSCNFCPDTFKNFKDLVEHYEDKHSTGAKQRLKLTGRIARDDMGCQVATEYLGYQSHCLQCPFDECVLMEPMVGAGRRGKRARSKAIIHAWKEGRKPRELAEEYHLSRRTINRIVSLVREENK